MEPSILVVDDEVQVRKLTSSILASAGFRTIEAEDGLAAYELLAQVHTAIRLVITDIRMPRMNGVELTERIRVEYPDIKVLCISGYSDPLSPNGHYVLEKPFKSSALRAMVEKVLAVGPQPEPKADLRQMEAELYVRLVAAEAKLEAAVEEYKRAAVLYKDVGDNSADGHLALRQALATQKAAFDEYGEALRERNQFLLDKFTRPTPNSIP